MMPQMESSEPRQQQSYGGYEGGQSYGSQPGYEDATYAQPQASKVYARPADNKNLMRLILAVFSIFMIFPFAVLFMIFIGGTSGWIGFAVACFTLFFIAVVGIEKIK